MAECWYSSSILQWGVSFMPQPSYPLCPLNVKLHWPQSQYERFGEEKIFSPLPSHYYSHSWLPVHNEKGRIIKYLMLVLNREWERGGGSVWPRNPDHEEELHGIAHKKSSIKAKVQLAKALVGHLLGTTATSRQYIYICIYIYAGHIMNNTCFFHYAILMINTLWTVSILGR